MCRPCCPVACQHDAPAVCAPGPSTPHVRTLRGLWSGPHRQLVEGGRVSAEVPLGESAAGTGFQVALERECAVFVRELEGDDQLPGAMLGGVMAASRVVPVDAGRHVAGHPCVETIAISRASKSVNKAFGHPDSGGKRNAVQSPLNFSRNLGLGVRTIAI